MLVMLFCFVFCDCLFFFFFFKQKTAYEMRISDWSSDVCSSDLNDIERLQLVADTIELALHLRSRHDMAIRLCPEIQFDAGSHEQVQRRFIDRRRPDRKSVV